MKAEQTLRSTGRREPDLSDLTETLPPGFPEGVLPDGELVNAIRRAWITADDEIPEASIQPASLDLRLGATAHRLRSSFLPGSKTVHSRLGEHQIGPEIPLSGDGAVLERNRPYLIRLMERMNLPPRLSARANPKSSTGRLDIFTRVVVDNGTGFDEIPENYSGPVYLEVVSRSFTVQVKEGLSLNQVRLVHGDKKVTNVELQRKHARSPLLYSPGIGNQPADVFKGVFLTVDLLGDADGRVGYRAKKNSALLDLSREREYRAEDFWEPVESIQGHRLILEPEEFYLLVSSERVAVNEDLAAELAAYDPTSGELRTHYAGFFDPGFGYPPTDESAGSRAVLEVRAHDVPFALEHGQRIARLEFETMAKPPTKLYGPGIGSSYQNQELWLSKHFQSQRAREPLPKPKDQMPLFPE